MTAAAIEEPQAMTFIPEQGESNEVQLERPIVDEGLLKSLSSHEANIRRPGVKRLREIMTIPENGEISDEFISQMQQVASIINSQEDIPEYIRLSVDLRVKYFMFRQNPSDPSNRNTVIGAIAERINQGRIRSAEQTNAKLTDPSLQVGAGITEMPDIGKLTAALDTNIERITQEDKKDESQITDNIEEKEEEDNVVVDEDATKMEDEYIKAYSKFTDLLEGASAPTQDLLNAFRNMLDNKWNISDRDIVKVIMLLNQNDQQTTIIQLIDQYKRVEAVVIRNLDRLGTLQDIITSRDDISNEAI